MAPQHLPIMQPKTVLLSTLLLCCPFLIAAQGWTWANSLGTANSNTTVKAIRPYKGTEVLVGGSYAASILNLGGQILQNNGQDDGYIAIADDAGRYSWAARFGGAGRDFLADAAAFPNGDFIVVGNFTGISMTIGGYTLLNSGETDAFVAKFNANKTLAWAKKIGTGDIDEIGHLAVDAAGNTYISGQVVDKNTQVTRYVFVRKIDVAGNIAWEQKGTIPGGTLKATALSLVEGEGIYLAGSLYGTATFGTVKITNDTSTAAFIIKYAPSGSVLDTYLNPNLDKINALKAYGNHLYACADRINWGIGWGWPLSDSKTHVLKLDADLNALWHKTAGGQNPNQSLDIAQNLSVDADGNAYVTGYFFSDTLRFAGSALPNLFNIHYYYPQIFVFKYSPAGDELWAKSLGGIHAEEGTSIHAVGDDKFYLGGNFESDPVAFGAHTLRNTGTLDSMYVHLRPGRYVRRTMGFLGFFDKAVSGVDSEPLFGEVSVFPNPTTDHCSVRLKSPADAPLTFQLYDLNGRLLRQNTYPSQTTELQVEMAGLEPGAYVVVLSCPSAGLEQKRFKTFLIEKM